MNQILIIQTAFVGDVVLTTPFIKALQLKWPETMVHIITTQPGCEILAGIENLTCHCLDKRRGFKGIANVLDKIRDQEFDIVFCVHRSFRSLWIGRKVKAKQRVAFHSWISKILGYETVAYPLYSENKHYSDKPMALLSVCGPVPVTPRPFLKTLTVDRTSLQAKIFKESYLVFSPFSVWGTKMWFSDRFARLGIELWKRYHKPIVIIGSGIGREKAIGQTIVQKIKSAQGQAVSLVGQTSLGELKALIEDASLVVSNDSAPVHIASAYDVPTIAIFGPTVKKWGFFPLATHSAVVERASLPCRPCSLHGPMRCPKKHFRCMDEIQVEDVMKAVENLYHASNSSHSR